MDQEWKGMKMWRVWLTGWWSESTLFHYVENGYWCRTMSLLQRQYFVMLFWFARTFSYDLKIMWAFLFCITWNMKWLHIWSQSGVLFSVTADDHFLFDCYFCFFQNRDGMLTKEEFREGSKCDPWIVQALSLEIPQWPLTWRRSKFKVKVLKVIQQFLW